MAEERYRKYLPERRVVVAFSDGDNLFRVYDSKDNAGLDVQFQVEFRGFVVMNGAKIGICNLKSEELNRLITWCSMDRAINLKKRVLLYAGYGNDVMPPLMFSGYIVAAYPTNPPDIWLNMELYQNFDILSSPNYYLKIEPQNEISISELVELVAKQLYSNNIAFKYNSSALSNKKVLDQKISNFSFEGSLKDFVEHLGNVGKTRNFSVIYSYNGILSFFDTEESGKDTDWVKPNFICSRETGMLGIPHPSYQYINTTMYMNPNIARQQIMEVRSKLIPSCNGLWRVWDVVHQGHLRGAQWQTSILGRIIGDYFEPTIVGQ